MNRPGLTGVRFGRLLVIAEAGRSSRGAVLWNCLCECGNTAIVTGGNLRYGGTVSCGCRRAELTTTKHGLNRTPVYRAWVGMRQRCSNPRAAHWEHYGGRGIAVCQRWLNSFESFLADMGIPPEGMTLDRIDVNGNYSPDNCRWATWTQQQRNKRNNRRIVFDGKELTIREWAEHLQISLQTLAARQYKKWPIERLLRPPLHPRRRIPEPEMIYEDARS